MTRPNDRGFLLTGLFRDAGAEVEDLRLGELLMPAILCGDLLDKFIIATAVASVPMGQRRENGRDLCCLQLKIDR